MSIKIPYARHLIDDDDIKAVETVLRGDWLTTGPTVGEFEESLSASVGATNGVAVSSGTAALHLAMLAADIGPGDEVIVPALTFAATANAVRYTGATVVFADVLPTTLTIDCNHVSELTTQRTRAVVAMDYGGTPCDLSDLSKWCEQHELLLIEDACHALGARYRDRPIGSLADLSIFSFHPVKHLATGEGGMITTESAELAQRLRSLRNHGIDADHNQRHEQGTWVYDMVELGFNYRMPDLCAALGISQLAKLPGWLETRRRLADRYSEDLAGLPNVQLPVIPADRRSAWHLYPIRLTHNDRVERRKAVFEQLRRDGIGVNVHYLPVYFHRYYRALGYQKGLCPTAERAYDGLLSLPLWPGLSDTDQQYVVHRLAEALDRS